MKRLLCLSLITMFITTLWAEQAPNYTVITLNSEQGESKTKVNVVSSPFTVHVTGTTLSLSGLPTGSIAMRLISMQGQVIMSSASMYNGTPLSIDLPSKIASGVYTLRVNSSSKVLAQKISIK